MDDRSPPVERDPLGIKYFPTTKPSHRLPHAWLEKDGRIVSTHDMVQDKPVFSLITDCKGQAWKAAADEASKRFDIGIVVAQIGGESPYRDYDDRWDVLKGFQAGGAVLVRPDNIVAWRSFQRSERDGQELADALALLLFGAEQEGLNAHSLSKL